MFVRTSPSHRPTDRQRGLAASLAGVLVLVGGVGRRKEAALGALGSPYPLTNEPYLWYGHSNANEIPWAIILVLLVD